MMRITFSLSLALLLVLGLALQTQAFEVTDADISGDSTFEIKVKTPINPALVGFFKCDEDAPHPFAYALFERDGKYMMFVKIDKKYHGYVGASLEGDTIYFGKGGHAKITLSEEGIHRTFKGKAKTRLVKTH